MTATSPNEGRSILKPGQSQTGALSSPQIHTALSAASSLVGNAERGTVPAAGSVQPGGTFPGMKTWLDYMHTALQ